MCWSCMKTTQLVSNPVRSIVPISLYRLGGQLHNTLAEYKRSHDPELRRRLTTQIAAMLTQFFGNHFACLTEHFGSGWDTVTVVPSKKPHTKRHALVGAPAHGEVIAQAPANR